MKPILVALAIILTLLAPSITLAQPAVAPHTVDLPTRADVTQRFLHLAPENPRAAVILFAGGQGNVEIADDGTIGRGGNFLVRSRELFMRQGLAVAVLDTPSDRRAFPFLAGFRDSDEHLADVAAVIAWFRKQGLPVWLVGTSRGTQSAAHAAVALAGRPESPDGLVLSSTILADPRSRPVPDLPLERLRIPVLVAHHEDDGCRSCAYSDMPRLMNRLAPLARKELLSFRGGVSRGDPCEARAYHGFNGIEAEVVEKIAGWILQAR